MAPKPVTASFDDLEKEQVFEALGGAANIAVFVFVVENVVGLQHFQPRRVHADPRFEIIVMNFPE